MTFSDSFKEFHNIRVNDNILLRQHVPENDAKDFYDIYKDQEAFANVKNHASNRSLEKAGFHKEGCLRRRSYLGKQFQDVNVWSLIREDIDSGSR